MAMFFKRMKKPILDENFQDAIKVENDFMRIQSKVEVDNDKIGTSKIKTISKDTTGKKEQSDFDFENMSKVIKRLENDVVDLKKIALENSHRFGNKSFKR